MAQVDAILWVCVFLFAAVSVVMLMHMTGMRRIDAQHAATLFKILIIQVVMAGVGAFGYFTYHAVRQKGKSALPNDQILILERGSPVLVMDGDRSMFLRSNNVRICFRSQGEQVDKSAPCERQVLELDVSMHEDMTDSTHLCIDTATVVRREIKGRTYVFRFGVIGTVAKRLEEIHGTSQDFVLLTMERSVFPSSTENYYDGLNCPVWKPKVL